MTNQENEKRFFKMLALCPEFDKYWDSKEGICKQRTLGGAINRLLSSADTEGESALLSFYAAVWFGNSDMFEFDFIKAMQVMDERSIKIIRAWMVRPFWCGDWA